MRNIIASIILLLLLEPSTSNLRSDNEPKHRNLQSNTNQPPSIMYTYLDTLVLGYEPDYNLLEIWKETWQKAGWQIEILVHDDAKKCNFYQELKQKLKESNIHGPAKHSFLRFCAMSTLEQGGFYSEYYAFPLHPYTAEFYSRTKKDGLLLLDRFSASVMVGTQQEWREMTKLLIDNMAPNCYQTLIKLHEKKGENNNYYHLQSMELLENIRQFNQDICQDASNNFFLRMHESEISSFALNGYDASHRASMLRNWFKYYMSKCGWVDSDSSTKVHAQPQQKEYTNALSNKGSVQLPPDKPIIHQDHTKSIAKCDDVSCQVSNACIGPDGVLKLFGPSDHIAIQQNLIKGKMTQQWVCDGCRREILIEAGKNFHVIWGKTATLAAGLSLNNCGHHIGDVIWPLVRLNLKFRNVTDVIQNGLGYLFLQSKTSPCDGIYNAVADQVTRYNAIHQDLCFEKIHFGTFRMNFMISSPNAFFVPYPDFHRDMRSMRSLFYNSYGIAESTEDEKNTMDSILIMYKKQGRKELRSLQYHNIANIPEIVQMIQSKFSNKYNVHIVSWDDYSIKQQVRLMARTRLIISLPGSAIMNAFLFRDNAALFCYCQQTSLDEKPADASTIILNNTMFQQSNEFLLWFDHFDYGNFFQVCSSEDMFVTRNGYGNSLDVVINVQRLEGHMKHIGM